MTESNGNLSLEELYAEANALCRKHWGVDYTGTIELVSTHWRSYNGKYIHRIHGKDVQIIRLSRKRNAERTREKVLGTLLHELVHWRLYTQGLPASDWTPEFVRECQRVGAPFSGTKIAQHAAQLYGGVTNDNAS